MRTTLDCIPCFIRQTLEVARMVSTDPCVHERTVRELLSLLSDMDLNESPPFTAQRIHRQLLKTLGVADPYREAKDRQNRLAMAMLVELRTRIESAKDPLALALRLAIAGNIIDMGTAVVLTEDSVRSSIESVMEERFVGDLHRFREAVSNAHDILYLADNAGEIAFDRLLIEQLLPRRITVAVRGAPIINDATVVDAYAVGLNEVAEIIDNGSDAPGTILDDCSDELKRHFRYADLILAKGQGNLETLSENTSNIFFLFKAKCPIVADLVRVPLGTQVLLHTGSDRAGLQGAL